MVTLANARLRSAFDRERARADLLNRGDASFKDDLQTLTEALQEDRRLALEQVRELHLAARFLMQAEALRLARLDPQDARIAALAQGADRALAQSAQLQQEATVAAVRVPRVKKTEALLHGRLVDDRGRPAAGVTVTLVDDQGQPVPDVAPVEADGAGYYALVVPAPAAARLPPEGRYTVALGRGGEQVRPPLPARPLGAGVVSAGDLVLDEAALEALHLRETLPAGTDRPALRKATPSKAAPRKANTPRKRAPHEPDEPHPPPDEPDEPEHPQ